MSRDLIPSPYSDAQTNPGFFYQTVKRNLGNSRTSFRTVVVKGNNRGLIRTLVYYNEVNLGLSKIDKGKKSVISVDNILSTTNLPRVNKMCKPQIETKTHPNVSTLQGHHIITEFMLQQRGGVITQIGVIMEISTRANFAVTLRQISIVQYYDITNASHDVRLFRLLDKTILYPSESPRQKRSRSKARSN